MTLTYESTPLSRVVISANGFAGADTARVERSTDQVTWTTVRGATRTPISGGSLLVYDYEFTPDVANYYRVTTAKDITFVSVGAAAHAVNANVTPALPAGAVAGDLLLVIAAIRTIFGNPNIPVGYTMIRDVGNLRLFAKIHSGSEVAPTVGFIGGGAGDDTSAQVAAFRNVQLSVAESAYFQFQAAAQNIAYPALTISATHPLILFIGWKQDDWTSVGTLPALAGDAAAEIGEPSTTTGNDQGIVWDYLVQTTINPVNVPTGSFLVTGGASATSSSSVVSMPPTTLTQTNSITPTLSSIWLKSPTRPFLNRTFYCVPKESPITRRARNGIFEVIGRSYPIAVTDVRQSREFTIDVVTRTRQEHLDFDLILSAGDIMYLQTPSTSPIPTMYVAISDETETRPLHGKPCGNEWRVFTLPVREVAAPSPDVYGASVTWQGVINTYATWQDVINAKATWLDLLTSVGTPADVIVG